MPLAPFVAFFLSGASSLIFQTLWARMLQHVFGAAPVANSTVLTVFMAGLGLGAWIGGRVARRIRHPLMAYAAAEVLVGLWGLVIPLLVQSDGWLADMNGLLRDTFGGSSAVFMIARFLCVVPILIVPTTLMGSTLPLLTRHFVRAQQDARASSARVGALYAVNTFGAATGPVLSAFVLMPLIGLAMTNVVACGMNFGLALLLYAARRPLLEGQWAPGEPLSIWPRPISAPPPRVEPASVEPTGVGSASAAGPRDVPAGPLREATPRAPDPTPAAEEPPRPAANDAAAAADLAPPAAEAPISALARYGALVAFAVSGGVALAYEVCWSRALVLTIGASIYSFALILDTFLIGIAAGSAAMSSLLSRGRTPLSGLAVASGLMVLLTTVPRVLPTSDGESEVSPDWVSAAVLGALFLTPVLLAWLFAERQRRRPRDLVGERAAFEELTLPALAMIAMPGFAALTVLPLPGYLPRIVASVVGLVVAFLALATLLRRTPTLLIALIQLFIGGATVVSYIWLDDIQATFAQLVVTIPEQVLPDRVGLVQLFKFLTAALVTFPAALGMGAMFPLTLRLWTLGGAEVSRDVGVVYASNTIGSIIGAWLPGFVLFAWIGMESTLHLGIAANLLLALALLIAGADEGGAKAADPAGSETDDRDGESAPARSPLWQTVTVYLLAPLIPVLLLLLYFGTRTPTAPLRWDLTRMTAGVFRVSMAHQGLFDPGTAPPELVFYKDGLTTTVSVERYGDHIALKNNGKVDASNGEDMPTQINVAAYPLLLHPEPPDGLDVAVVGFGSGVTVGTALQFPVARVDVVELERSIPRAASAFAEVNHLTYARPDWPYVEMDRLTVINDDGRNYLASTSQDYDVIISEPSNPWISGVSDLFTVDHFRITKKRLRPGGIYCQWVQLYELSPGNIKTIYRSFASQFDHVMVLSADRQSSDTVMLGSDRPILLDVARVEERFRTDAIREELARANVHSPYDLFARTLLANRDEVLHYSQVEERRRGDTWEQDLASLNVDACEPPDCRRRPALLNTDDNARIELAAPRDLIGFARFHGYLRTVYSHEWPYGHPRDALASFGEGDEAARRYAELAMAYVSHGRYRWAGDFIEASERAGTARETAVALEVLTHLLSSDAEPTVRLETPVPPASLSADDARRFQEGFDEVRGAIQDRRFGAALRAIEEIPGPLRRTSTSLRFLYGFLLYKAAAGQEGREADLRAAAVNLDDLVRDRPEFVQRHPEVHYYLAKAYDADGRYGRALRAMRTYVEARLVLPSDDDAVAPEPGPGEAPTTDAPGIAPKDEHVDRG
ncbi:MAG: fused MFS/spermidine synthase [Sandaracinaceae bacterium]